MCNGNVESGQDDKLLAAGRCAERRLLRRRSRAASAARFRPATLALCALGLIAASFAGLAPLGAQAPNGPPVRRAAPPEFSAQERAVFFEDAFSRVVGQRPDQPGAAAVEPPGRPASGTPAADEPAPSGRWSHLISDVTLEDEVKALKVLFDDTVTTPSRFRAQGYREARQHLSVLAMVFGIISDYDGPVRWRDQAALARDRFSQTAGNARSGAVQVYNEARLRAQDLQDLLGGARLDGTPVHEELHWGRVVDRPPLMRRLELAFDERLTPWVNQRSEFEANRQRLIHEAEMVAVIAEVLTQDGMMDAGDSIYDEAAHQMRDAARAIIEAVRHNRYDEARTAAGEIHLSCSDCHDFYR